MKKDWDIVNLIFRDIGGSTEKSLCSLFQRVSEHERIEE
jgi:hypothetical protein